MIFKIQKKNCWRISFWRTFQQKLLFTIQPAGSRLWLCGSTEFFHGLDWFSALKGAHNFSVDLIHLIWLPANTELQRDHHSESDYHLDAWSSHVFRFRRRFVCFASGKTSYSSNSFCVLYVYAHSHPLHESELPNHRTLSNPELFRIPNHIPLCPHQWSKRFTVCYPRGVLRDAKGSLSTWWSPYGLE